MRFAKRVVVTQRGFEALGRLGKVPGKEMCPAGGDPRAQVVTELFCTPVQPLSRCGKVAVSQFDQAQANLGAGVVRASGQRPVELRLRDDVVSESDEREANQRSAPLVEDGLFLVPKVIE